MPKKIDLTNRYFGKLFVIRKENIMTLSELYENSYYSNGGGSY